MIYRLFTLLLAMQLCSASCQQPAKPTAVTDANSDSSNTRRFVFNPQQQNIDPKDPKNLCVAKVSGALPVFPDQNNGMRRYIFLEKNARYKVGVTLGNSSNRTIYKWDGGEQVEISTSDNFPVCLSNRLSYLDTPEPNRIHYDNQRRLVYDVFVLPEGEATKLVFELDWKAGFGLEAYKIE
jgi:hypothetical protein